MKTTMNMAAAVTRDAAVRPESWPNEEPFLCVDWERVVFLHFALDPKALCCHLPWELDLELYEDEACVTLVALTMRSFRACRPGFSAGWLLRPIATQKFLNVRTYARCGNERGAFFLWGWLSRPFRLPLPSGLLGLPYHFASLRYEHQHETGELCGTATVPHAPESFRYHAHVGPDRPFLPSSMGTLAEFALERYTGWFQQGRRLCAFRAWHPPWLQTPIDVAIEDSTLVTARLPWFKEARLIHAHYALAFAGVQLSQARRVCHLARCESFPSGTAAGIRQLTLREADGPLFAVENEPIAAK